MDVLMGKFVYEMKFTIEKVTLIKWLLKAIFKDILPKLKKFILNCILIRKIQITKILKRYHKKPFTLQHLKNRIIVHIW